MWGAIAGDRSGGPAVAIVGAGEGGMRDLWLLREDDLAGAQVIRRPRRHVAHVTGAGSTRRHSFPPRGCAHDQGVAAVPPAQTAIEVDGRDLHAAMPGAT